LSVRQPNAKVLRLKRSTDRMREKSRTDLLIWGAELAAHAGLTGVGDVCIVQWSHDESCALHPAARSSTPSSRCSCAPDGTAIVNPGCLDERRTVLVLDGEVLPVERRSTLPPWCRSSAKPS
jgi:hypothetical protein